MYRRSIMTRFMSEAAVCFPTEPIELTLSASFVDRILKGEKPTNAPVQAPVNFQMALNARTANALGLTVPLSISLLADEVIQ